jgi:hypothetical protein
MKNLTFLLLVTCILFASACNKMGIPPKTTSFKTAATLPGKWKLIGTMLSAGGPEYFVPDNNKDYVTFNTDGTLGGTAFSGFKFYTVKDTVTINMTQADMITYENYYYKIKGDSLSLSPAGPSICIEGCEVKLVKE